MKYSNIFIIFLFICTNFGSAQNQVLTPQDFLGIVKEFHPISTQAALQPEFGKFYKRYASGAFDPSFFSHFDEKFYDSTLYWNNLNTELKIPTLPGLDFKVGFENYRGKYVNEERTIPEGGLLYAGVSVNVLSGLITDHRRTALKQAKLFRDQTEFDRRQMLNELFADAIDAYTQWQRAYYIFNIYEEFVELAYERYEATKQLFFSGDGPAIDTVEALIILQNRLYKQLEAQLDFANSTLHLSNFLWDSNGNPQLLSSNIVPVDDSLFILFPVNIDSLNNALIGLGDQPELRFAQYKLDFQRADLRLRTLEMLPMLRLNYNPIVAFTGFNPETINALYMRNNYKAGFDFKFNLLTRKERGMYGMSKVLMRDAQLNLDLKQNAIELKLRESFNKAITLRNQQNILVNQVSLSERLLDAENRKFSIGESSIFLINAREQALLENKIKALDAGYKACNEEVSFYVKSGTLFRLVQ